MILILCHPHDTAACWLNETWAARGIGPAALVTVEEVACSRRILHRLDSTGDSSVVQLAAGRSVALKAVTGLINRVQYVPTDHFSGAAAGDRDYAREELYAWLLAWLDSAGSRAVNQPQPYSLGGGELHPAVWAHSAAVAGLPTDGWRSSTTGRYATATPIRRDVHTVIVFRHLLYGARRLPPAVQDACRRLAVLVGMAVLQIDVERRDDDRWRFVTATGMADFRAGGWPLASAIAAALLPGRVPV